MKQFNTRIMITIAIMSSISVVLYAFEIPVFYPLKMDFSDLPVMVTGYAFGFIPAILVAFLKNLIHLFFMNSSVPVVGEFANFSFAVLVSIPFVFRKKYSWKQLLIASIASIIIATVGMFIINFFITMPWYGIKDPATRLTLLFTQYSYLNIMKSTVLCIVFAIMKPQIDRMKR